MPLICFIYLFVIFANEFIKFRFKITTFHNTLSLLHSATATILCGRLKEKKIAVNKALKWLVKKKLVN